MRNVGQPACFQLARLSAGNVKLQQRHQACSTEQLNDALLVDIEFQLLVNGIGTQHERHDTVGTRSRAVHGAVAARNGQAHTSHHDEWVSQPWPTESDEWGQTPLVRILTRGV